VWPSGNVSAAVDLGSFAGIPRQSGLLATVDLRGAPARLAWRCTGGGSGETARAADAAEVWTAELTEASKPAPCLSSSPSGRIKWNAWRRASSATSVPFSSRADGYFCTKIPVLLRTQRGSLLAFSESRYPSCSDFATTELVLRRSTDGGQTWSALQRVAAPPPGAVGWCQQPNATTVRPPVVGNAAPVQLANTSAHHPGRILLPHTRDNFEVYLVHSDDDGLSWSSPRLLPNMSDVDPAAGPQCERDIGYLTGDGDTTLNGTSLCHVLRPLVDSAGSAYLNPYAAFASKLTGPWQFVGTGPPGALALSSGRVLVPAYHSFLRGRAEGDGGAGAGVASLPVSQLFNNLAVGHLLSSDDGGDTWTLRASHGFTEPTGRGANEDQFAQLANGSVVVNSRSMATISAQARVQARSDDRGDTWTPTHFVPELPEPFGGCAGSFVSTDAGRTLVLSHPDPDPTHIGVLGRSIVPALASLVDSLGGGVVRVVVSALQTLGIGGDALRLVSDALHCLGDDGTRQLVHAAAALNFTGRERMRLWSSVDGGASYDRRALVDDGPAGYSSLVDLGGGKLGLLYEQSDPPSDADASAKLLGGLQVLTPDRLVYREVTL
jgi:hypothetical protein